MTLGLIFALVIRRLLLVAPPKGEMKLLSNKIICKKERKSIRQNARSKDY
jgi:hypothetical protein